MSRTSKTGKSREPARPRADVRDAPGIGAGAGAGAGTGQPDIAPLLPPLVARAVAEALAEDLGLVGDVTTASTIEAGTQANAVIRARAGGVVSGPSNQLNAKPGVTSSGDSMFQPSGNATVLLISRRLSSSASGLWSPYR